MYKNYSDLGAKPQEGRDHYDVSEIQNSQHKNELLANNQIVLVDVYADWCGPCRQIAPEYATLAKQLGRQGQCAIVKENYEKKLSDGITGIPTFNFYKHGKLVDQVVGAGLDEVKEKLQTLLDNLNTSSTMTGPQYSRNSIRNHGSLYNGVNQPNMYQ